MKLFRTLMVLAAAVPFAQAANKDMIELQRDVALLQDQVRQMNDKIVALMTLVQTTLDNTRQSNISIVSMQDRVNDSLKKQEQLVVAPVQSVGAKLDSMTQDFGAVRENVLDMNSRLNKLDAKITDLQNLCQTIKTMPAPPPPQVQTGPDGAGIPPATANSSGPPPGMQAETTYTNAYRDYVGGNYDLAMQEFTDYLKYFPTTTFAPNAQFYIGDIFYRRKDYDNAVIAFDAVLEHFPENNKTPDAHLMKGRSLLAGNKRDAAAKEFREVIQRYPDTDQAAKAKSLLKELGLSASSSTSPKPRPKKHR